MTLALLFVAIVLYSLMLTALARASGKIDPFWSGTIFGLVSTLTPLAVWLISRAQQKSMLTTTTTGILYTVVAGAIAGIFISLLVKIFEKDAVAFATPVIYGGALAMSSLIGWLFFRESITPMQAAGILTTTLGVSIIVYSKMHGITA